jgi:epoxyqueuosine reductase QueG
METHTVEFTPRDAVPGMRIGDVLAMDEDAFRGHFSGTPVTRAKLQGLQRNARTVLAQHESNTDMHTESFN